MGYLEHNHDTDHCDDEQEPFYDEDEICADCGRIIHGEDVCCVCGAAMCFACFEMGCGVCRGPHK